MKSLLFVLVCAVVPSAQAVYSVRQSLLDVVPRVNLEIQGVTNTEVQAHLFTELQEALKLLYLMEPEGFVGSFKRPSPKAHFANRSIEIVAAAGHSFSFQGRTIPVGGFDSHFSRYQEASGEVLQIAMTLSAAVLSPKQEPLPLARYHFLRVLLRPYFSLLPVHLAVTAEESRELPHLDPPRWEKKALEQEERYSEMLEEWNYRDWGRPDSLTLRAYLQLAWLDWSQIANSRGWSSRHLAANAAIFGEFAFKDFYMAPVHQANFWRTYGAALALVRLLPPPTTLHLFAKEVPKIPSLLALSFLDSRDVDARSSCPFVRGVPVLADRFPKNRAEYLSYTRQGGRVTSGIFWTDQIFYDPETKVRRGSALGRLTLALAAGIYHSFEKHRQGLQDEVWDEAGKEAHVFGYQQAAIDFYQRLRDSRYWKELSDLDQAGFNIGLSQYEGPDDALVASCAYLAMQQRITSADSSTK